MTSSFETDAQKSPEALEREIDAKRASISSLVDSLERRLSPGQLIDQALAYTKGGGGEFFHNLSTTVKNNPVPTLLTGFGIAWLAINQNKPYVAGPPSSGPSLKDKVSGALGQASDAVGQAGSRLHEAVDQAKDTTHSLGDKVSDLGHRAADTLGASTQQAREFAHDIQGRLQTQASQLPGQLKQLMNEQPLVVAAVGIALGALLGAALPSTRQEDELLGAKSDSAVEKIKATAKELLQDTKDEFARSPDDSQAKPAGAATQPVAGTDLSGGLGMRT